MYQKDFPDFLLIPSNNPPESSWRQNSWYPYIVMISGVNNREYAEIKVRKSLNLCQAV
jgi:hypothetical protein